MATMTTSDVRLSALPPASGRAGLRGVIASEFTKIRSVRSTYWTIAALIVVSVGIATLIGFGITSTIHNQPWNKAGTDATQAILTPFLFIGQLIIAVIGAMVITSEYSTGMIRTSLTAMPRRGTVYLGKLIVITSATLVVSLVTSFLAFFAGSLTLSGSGVGGSLFHNVTIPMGVNMSPGKGGPGSQPNYTFVGHLTDHPGARAQRDHRRRAVRHRGGADRLRPRRDHPAHRRGDHLRDRPAVRAVDHHPDPAGHRGAGTSCGSSPTRPAGWSR